MADRPNVVVVTTDQQFAGAVGHRNDDLDTPAMDRLARSGVSFRETYCACPLCLPSRASMLTGRPSHRALDRSADRKVAREYRGETLGALFADAGYDCGYGGKWDLSEGRLSMAPGGECGFERVCPMDDSRLADACAEFVARDRESPFLLVAGFENPHNICEWIDGKPPAWGSVPEAPTEECPTLPANFHPPPGEPDALRPAAADSPVDFQLAGRPDDVWRHYRHVYYRLVERVDREVGRVLDALDSAGVADETVVVFTSDHGDSHGAHGLGHKMFLYEESARVPFVVRDPAGGGGRVDDSLVSNGYDLLPTLCDYAGIDPPADLPGRSVRPLVRGGAPDWREYLVARAEVPLEGRMVRTDRYKYVVYEGGRDREQLFDLRSDRGEMVDLSADADHAGTLDAHRAHLLEWCRRTDDTFAELSSRPGLPSVPGYEYDEIAAYMAE